MDEKNDKDEIYDWVQSISGQEKEREKENKTDRQTGRQTDR